MHAMPRLPERVAIITGGARGIGAAIAERFAAEGARVVIADVDTERVTQTAKRISPDGSTALSVTADISDPDDVNRLFTVAAEAFGELDVLVNNAADNGRGGGHFLQFEDRWWHHIIATNLTGSYLCARRAAPSMARRGSGAIINVSSGGGTRSHRGMVPYDASKGGLEALTRALALELAPYGVRVNTLVPGLIATYDGETDEQLRLRADTVPLRRGGTAGDLAGPAVFLASADSAYVTGARLVVDGGVLVQQRSPQVDFYPPEHFPDLADIR